VPSQRDGKPYGEIFKQSDLLLKFFELKSPAGAGDTKSGNKIAATHENRRGYATESFLQFVIVRCITPMADQGEIVHQVIEFGVRVRSEAGHPIAFDDGADFFIGKPGENRFACGSAVRMKTCSNWRARGDDRVSTIDAVEADDTARFGHGDAHTFIREARQFHQETVRFIAKRPGFQGAASQFVQPQTKAVSLIGGIFFDEFEFLHGVQEAEDGGLVQAKVAGKLRHAHLGPAFAEMEQEPKGFLQGFAGTHVAATP